MSLIRADARAQEANEHPASGHGRDDVSGFLCALTPSNGEDRLNRNKHEL